MRKIKNVLILILVVMTGVSCSMDGDKKVEKVPGIVLDYMDTTADPANDFFRYVNGGWLDKANIPADRGRWGSFDELRKQTSDNMLAILKKSIDEKSYETGSDQEKAVVFYETAMDTAYLDNLGLNPIIDDLKRIDDISNIEELQEYLVSSAPLQVGVLYGFGIMPGFDDSNIYDPVLGPGTLGLPETDYYLKDDEDTKLIQEKYIAHVARMFTFLDYSQTNADKVAQDIYNLEKRMASVRLTKEERRNIPLLNNPRSVQQIQDMTPAFNWEKMLYRIGASGVDTIVVTELKFMDELNNILKEEPIETIKNYAKWSLFNDYAVYLSTTLDEANFDFYGKVLEGTESQKPRWERVLNVCNGTIGEALGKLYVDAYFPPEAKETALEMVTDLKEAFGERIKKLPWMSDTTKERALKKLQAFKVKIGYPDNWKDYGTMVIKGPAAGGSYYANMKEVNKWNWERDLNRINKAVDKSEWFMPPQVVNAYYNPFYNEIVFPAAILQPPFYNYQADAAVNYGGIGAVIGHEMSHGFDDMGSRFDADGNLKNWWTESDRERFNDRTKLLIAQFDAYEPLEGIHINGEFTLGENIGDLGGLNIAYDGLQRYIAKHGDPGLIDGYTQDQRFFISWGTIWRTKMRDEALKTRIKTDPHSPGMFRAIAPQSNMKSFYAAFDVNEGDAMYRSEKYRVYIW
jgi:predicted metalloendopeptidase